MSEKKLINASTVARIAGNILSGYMDVDEERRRLSIVRAVEMARQLVAEVERTEPKPEPL